MKNFQDFITEDYGASYANSDHFLNDIHKNVGIDGNVTVKITEMEPINRPIDDRKERKYVMKWEIFKKDEILEPELN